jgi:Tfp pilus assembly protein PilF
MGAEKYANALTAIEKALAIDPDNQEYLATRDLIQKAMKRNK